MPALAADVAAHALHPENILAKNLKVRLVRSERQHDQVRVEPIEYMAQIWVIAWLCTLVPYKVHDLVFAFARHACVRENNGHVLPAGIVRQLVCNVEP